MTDPASDLSRYCEFLLAETAPIRPDEVRPVVFTTSPDTGPGWRVVLSVAVGSAAVVVIALAVLLRGGATGPNVAGPRPSSVSTTSAPDTTAPPTTEPPTTIPTGALSQAERDAASVADLFSGLDAASEQGADAYVAYLADHTVPGVEDPESCRAFYLSAGAPTYEPDLDRMAGQGMFPDRPGYRRYSLPVSVSGGIPRLEWVAVSDDGALWSFDCVDPADLEGPHETNGVVYDAGGCYLLDSDQGCNYPPHPDVPQIAARLDGDSFSWMGPEVISAGPVQIGYTSAWGRDGGGIVLIVGFAEDLAWEEAAPNLSSDWTLYPLGGMSGGPGSPVFGARLENSCACGSTVWIYAVYDLPPGHYLLAGTTGYWDATVQDFEHFGSFEVVADSG